MDASETADKQAGGCNAAQCGYGGEIITYTFSGGAEVSCPFSQVV